MVPVPIRGMIPIIADTVEIVVTLGHIATMAFVLLLHTITKRNAMVHTSTSTAIIIIAADAIIAVPIINPVFPVVAHLIKQSLSQGNRGRCGALPRSGGRCVASSRDARLHVS